MDETKILECLNILSKAEISHKLCKATGEWYKSGGIFSALYRTMSGDSRNDILDLMDSVVVGLESVKDITNTLVKNQLLLAIGEATSGCDKIIETYRTDSIFMEAFMDKLESIKAFKQPKKKTEVINTTFNLRNHQSPVNITNVINRPNGKFGVEIVNQMIKNSTQPESIDSKESP